jgi:hypothetical protein
MENHTVHHILTLYALGASEDDIRKAYEINLYQRDMVPSHHLATILDDREGFKKYLGKEESYSDFLEFFTVEIEKTSWQEVLNEYLFKGDERADDMLQRLFAGRSSLFYGIKSAFLSYANYSNNRLYASTHTPRFWSGISTARHHC